MVVKKNLPLILCLICSVCSAQIVVDKNISKAFYVATKHLSADNKQLLNSKETAKMFSGFQIFTQYHSDTLNKKELIKRPGTIAIKFIDPTTGKESPPEMSAGEKNTYNAIPYITALINDTLLLEAPGFPPNLAFKISKSRLQGTYCEYSKWDTVFRLNPLRAKTNSLIIPVYTKFFKISTSHFKAGQTIYGGVEFTTEPYYVDDTNFNSGYLKTRLRGRFVFKAKIISPGAYQ